MTETALHIEHTAPPAKLLDLVRTALRVRHYSYKTEKAYIRWIMDYIRFHGTRHPKDLTEKHVTEFLNYLAVVRKVAAATQNQALCAVVLLYRDVLNAPMGTFENLVWAKKPARLPTVLSKGEVQQVIDNLHGTPRLIATILYGAGLRLNECLRLRVKDLDFSYHQVSVWEAKGAKCRVTMLPKVSEQPLKVHLEKVRKLHRNDLSRGFGVVEP